jgi:hypothetical protein
VVDSIHLEVDNLEDARLAGQVTETLIYVNGRNLIDILREVEMPFALKEGHPDIAGGYMGLPPNEVFLPSKHLLGEPAFDLYKYPGEKVEVLQCVCGVPGCWPFLVRITDEGDRVVWSDFEQPHRSGVAGRKKWDYQNLQPFVFDKAQYMAELQAKP